MLVADSWRLSPSSVLVVRALERRTTLDSAAALTVLAGRIEPFVQDQTTTTTFSIVRGTRPDRCDPGSGCYEGNGFFVRDPLYLGDSVRVTVFQASRGNANLDGRFDSGDLVQVFISGKYQTGLPATWSEGDWNDDGVFDSSDLVAAFQDGRYGL
jgi:hypothetical protein